MPNLAERFELRNTAHFKIGDPTPKTFKFIGLRNGAPDPNGAYTRAILEATRRVDEMLAERDRLVADGRLTETGIRERLQEKAEELSSTEVERPGNVDDNLARLEMYRTRLADKIAKLRHELEGPPSPESPVEVHKDAEMRLYLRQEKDGPGRQRFLREAVRDGRDDVIRAALDGAPELAGLTREQQVELREKAIQANNSEIVEEIEALQYAKKRLEHALDNAQGAIRAIASESIPGAEGSAA